MDFSPDASNIFNKVRVYGKEVDGFPIMATEQDSSSQATYEVRDLRIDNANISTVEEAKEKAEFELVASKDPPTVGSVVSLGLPTLVPGQQLRISDPLNELNPGYYKVFEFRHMFSNSEPFKTEVTLQKERTTIPNILKPRISFESDVITNVNPNDLDYSYIETFDSSSGSFTNTRFRGGQLETDGSSTGTWNSGVIVLNTRPSEVSFSIKGSDITNVTVRISLDGVTFVPVISNGVGQTFTLSFVTTNLIIEVDLNSANAKVETLAVLYK